MAPDSTKLVTELNVDQGRLSRRTRRDFNKKLGRPRNAPLKITEWKTLIIREWEENGVKHNSHRHLFSITCVVEGTHIHTHDTDEDSGGGGYCGAGVNHDHNCTVNAGSDHNHVFSGYTGLTTANDLFHTHTISITSQAGINHQHNLPANWSSSFCSATGCEADPHLHVAGGANANESSHTHGLNGATGNGTGLLRWHSHSVNFASGAGSAHTHIVGTATISDVSCHTGYLHDHGGGVEESSAESTHVHTVTGDTEYEGEPVDGSDTLYAQFDVGQDSVDLAAGFDGQTSIDLFGEFFVRNAGTVDLSAEFEVRHVGIPGGLPAEFIVRHETSVNLDGEFIIRHETSQSLKSGFRVRCPRRFGGNWQRKMWFDGTYYWRGRYDSIGDELIFEYIAAAGLATNIWTKNAAASISGLLPGCILADFTVRGGENGIPTTIHYSDGLDSYVAESDEASATGWAWQNNIKVFDATTTDCYRKVNLCANRTTPTPRLWVIAVFSDDSEGTQWVKARRQTTGGNLANWDAEVDISSAINTATIYGCSARSMGDAGALKNNIMVVYKEGAELKSKYYNGAWQAIQTIDLTTLPGRAAWDLEHGEVAGENEGHIIYVDGDTSVKWRERDPGAASVWTAAEELHAADPSHRGVGIIEHGSDWLWLTWEHGDEAEYRLHLCDPETWWPLLVNPPLTFDPATIPPAVVDTTTIDQLQTPDVIPAGSAIPICWIGQTGVGVPCDPGWGILIPEARENLPAQFEVGQGSVDLLGELVIRHVGIPVDLKAFFEGQTSVDLLGEFIVCHESSVDLFAQFEVAQWQEDLFGKFIVRHSATLGLHGAFDGQASFNLPAEFVIRRSGLLNVPAEFVILQAWWDIPAEFFVRNAGIVDLSDEFIIRHETERNLSIEFFVINAAILNLPGKFVVRRSATRVLSAEFFIKQAAVDLLGEFIVKQWAVDLPAEFEVGQDSQGLLAEFIVRYETSEDLFAEFFIINAAILNLPGEFIVRRSATLDLPAEFFVNQTAVDLLGEFNVGQDAVDLYAEFEVGQDQEDLLGEFIVRHETSVNLLAEFIIRHEAPVDLFASFDGQTSVDLLGEFIVRQERSVDLLGEFIVRHTTGIANLLGEFMVRQFSSSTVDLVIAYDPSAFFNYFENVGTGFLSNPRYSSDHAVKVAGQSSLRIQINYGAKGHDYIQFGWKYRNPVVGEDTWPGSGLAANLPMEFSIRRSASLVLSTEFEVGQGSEDLLAEFIVRHEAVVEFLTLPALPAEFIVRQERSVNLLGEFIVRHIGIPRNLPAEFEVGQDSENLPAEFIVLQWQEDLPGEFIVRYSDSLDLACEFVVRHIGIPRNLPAEFCITYEVSESVDAGLAETLVFGDTFLQSEDLQAQLAESITFFPFKGSADAYAHFIVRNIGSADLLSRFEVNQSFRDLLGKAVIRHSGAPLDLFARFEAQVTLGLLAGFDIGQDSAGLLSRFKVGQGSADLPSRFEVG